jgi:hypothetical protein
MFLYDKVVLNGVGKIKLQLGGVDNATNPPVYVGHAKNFGIELSATQAEARGGQSKFPLATRLAEKSWKISCAEAMLRAEGIQMTQGTFAIPSSIVLMKKSTCTCAATSLAIASSYVSGQCIVLYANGTRLTQVASSATPSAGEFAELTPSAGTIKVSAADVTAASVLVSYYSQTYDTGANASSYDLIGFGAETQPCTYALHYLHEDAQCSNTDYAQFFFFQVRPTGALSLSFAQGTDIVGLDGIEFIVEDPLRADGCIGWCVLKHT